MRRASWVVLVLLPAWLAALGGAQTAPARAVQGGNPGVASPAQPAQAQNTPTAAGIIRGRVVRVDTGAPLPRAYVVAAGPAGREHPVTADDRGNYEIRNLPAGRYTLNASKTGYVTTTYGQRTSTPIDLAERQVVSAINVSLPRAGVIEGRVVDEHGEPSIEAQVHPRVWRNVNGVRQLVGVGGEFTITDDLGRFRLHGLVANTYVLTVFPRSNSNDDASRRATYYPNTLVPTEAQPIEVSEGQEVGGVTIQLASGRLATISGTVTSSDGQPASVERVSLSGSAPSGASRYSAGSFSIANVAPGSYTLMVGTTTREMAMMPLTVDSSDLTLSLLTTKGGTVRGRVTFDPAPPPGIQPESVAATFQLVGLGSYTTQQISNDWKFGVPNIFGTGMVVAVPRASGGQLNPDAWMMKSILHHGIDVTDVPMDFTKGVDDLEIVLTTRVTRITGTVTDRRGAPVRDATVLLFPDDPAKWTTRVRFKTARLNQSGQFTVTGLPPGRYLAAAVDVLQSGEERDPQLLERLRPSATSVTLNEGDQKSVTLRITEP